MSSDSEPFAEFSTIKVEKDVMEFCQGECYNQDELREGQEKAPAGLVRKP